MNLEIVIPRDCHTSEVSQTRERQIYNTAYVWGKKSGTNKLIYKTEIESRMQKTNLTVTSEETGMGGINWEIGIDILYHYI